MSHCLSIVSLGFLLLSAFITTDKDLSEYSKLQNLEYQALNGTAGKAYTLDLIHKKGCNKTRVHYLGIAHTNSGRAYKILTSFFVFSASATCHGTSRIKIFDIRNRYIGQYRVGMPEDLPDTLTDNTLLYFKNSEDCILKTTRPIDLHKGLPKKIFINCSKNEGNEYAFSSGD
jgi:hypothetical protein